MCTERPGGMIDFTLEHALPTALNAHTLLGQTEEHSPFPKCWANERGEIVYANATFHKVFTPPEATASPLYFYNIHLALDETVWQYRWQSIISTGQAHESEALLKCAHDRYRAHKILMHPVRVEGCSLLSILLLEQPERMPEALVYNDADLFRYAMEQCTHGIWDWDLITNEVFYSDRVYELLGYTRTEFPGSLSAFERLVHPDDFLTIQTAVHSHIQDRVPYCVEYRIRHKNGQYRWHTAQGKALYNDAGEAIRFIGINMDIHENKSAAERLQTECEGYRELLDALPALIFLKDDHNTIIRANRKACESIGLPHEQVEGRRTEDFYPAELAAAYLKDDLAVIETGQARLGIIEPNRTPKEETRWVRTDKIPYYIQTLRSPGVLVMALDVTEQLHRQAKK
jgi:PAS domain S-box-containing protein